VSEIIETRMADDTWGVATVESTGNRYQRRPCHDADGRPVCPWTVDAPIGAFPVQAFVDSARTAYDLATTTFGCRTSGMDRPATCAGFILRGAYHNLGARLRGLLAVENVTDGGHELYPSYRAMAEANGVPPDHPALAECRDDGGVR
jgi:hypothetical protein